MEKRRKVQEERTSQEKYNIETWEKKTDDNSGQ